MVPNEAGDQETVQTIRGAGSSQQELSVPTRLSVRFNPGAYYIGFGTTDDTCVAATDCDDTIGRCPPTDLACHPSVTVLRLQCQTQCCSTVALMGLTRPLLSKLDPLCP